MNDTNPYQLTITSNVFADMRAAFNKVLREALRNMEQEQSDDAEINLKLKIHFIHDEVGGFPETREIVRPYFEHKVTSVMKIESRESGVFAGAYELVWDETAGNYIAVPLGKPQISMISDEDDVFGEFDESSGPEILDAIPAPEDNA